MKKFLRRLFKYAAYTAAGVVILLAIAVGLFRLFLPRLPEYQDNIKDWASAAIGMEVEFSGMDARWGLTGPELAFYEAQLIREGVLTRVVAVEEVRVGVALTRLLLEGTPVVDRIVIRNTSIEVRQLDDGRWWVQGAPADEWLGSGDGGKLGLSDAEVIGEDIEIVFLQPGDERPKFFEVPRATVSIDKKRLAFDAGVRLPEELGRQLNVAATQRLTLPKDEREWDVIIEAEDIDLAGWSDLQRTGDRRVLSGTGDLDLSVAYANGRVRGASADIDFTDVLLAEAALFDLSGRFELNVAAAGWLVAAEEFQVTTADHQWPEASLRAEVSTDDEGRIVLMDVRASYLDLRDADLIASWLSPRRRQQLADFAPNGIVRELVATIADAGSESPRFDVAAELQSVGVAAAENRPGVQGFSGTVRANRLGGRIEVRSSDMIVDLPQYFSAPIDIDFAEGTIIWRSSDESTTVLSDSIRIRNEVLDSQSSVQLIIGNDETSPEIDLASTWSVADVSAVTSYLPTKIIKPNLQEWFESALVSGSIPQGTTTLKGKLDEFPFDNGEGRLLLEASLRDSTFVYQSQWPAAQLSEMEVVLDNTRLYSLRNRAQNLGNETVDARIEIEDLRNPILTIEAFSTGTLETIRSYLRQSPIADVFGGQLDRVTVSGEASLALDLTIPLKDPKSFEFTSRVRSNNGTLAVEGFTPQVTDLIGEVTIVRDDISSTSLGGRFLGQDIVMEVAKSEDPRFNVAVSSRGSVTAEAIVEELGVPLDGLINGSKDYETRILFPAGDQEVPSPLTVQIASDLEGLGFDLPDPVGKAAESPLQIEGDIRFMPGGEKIESAGLADNGLAWQVAFNRLEDAWDFDRGVLALGSDVMESAQTRGLHIRGVTSTVRLEEWLSLSRSGEEEVGVAERIRSIDLLVADFYAVGQHLQGHQVRVDRSARDWLVQIEGEDIVGSVFVPYDFGSERAMVVEMERLHLPGDDESADEPSTLDPRTLPPITLTASDFALGVRNFGAVEARVERVEGGLEATTITTKDDTFDVVGTGNWVADESDPLGSRTSVTATLTSSNVKETMARLNFTPGIVSKQMTAEIDLSWSGGPRADFLDVLDGEVQVRFGDGQLEEVKPGAGRVFGLMSIVALPRRLSFDFRDVFSKGFGFDKISGTFRIVDGESYTCDLSLAGPAADIGIVGRASLANRDYEQTAVVSANVGNTLPIVGAVVAGPQAAAALLIFSQIFKKPLQEVGQVYYGINGSWDEPIVESTDAANFASTSELAGCLAAAE